MREHDAVPRLRYGKKAGKEHHLGTLAEAEGGSVSVGSDARLLVA